MQDTIRKDLENLRESRINSMGRTVNRLRMHFSSRVMIKMQELGYSTCTYQHTAVFANIDIEGSNIVTLADRAKISKQAMSKLVKDIEEKGYVETIKDPKDSRAVLVLLTDKGAKLIIDVQQCINEIRAEMDAALGKEKVDIFLSIANEMSNHFEEKQK
ncbi:MarR family winged helix-turn-helix transcriptional regulator [Solitalea lacus]|uniref:MarR family winged helix-turn-helix transcriptional regulator n=1 Tax=Solitalea lacus TaxID=2911172 RepID=UPI001EDA20D5|nr:MarR family transcriptional regulator [Solitalea lacus]UKJ05979.1 winged helix DNA-binding protein [Solitalea lacus]